MRIPFIGLSAMALVLASCNDTEARETQRVGAGTYKLDVDETRVPAQPGEGGAVRTGDAEATLELEEDGTYSFSADVGDLDVESEGRWTLQGQNLTLTPTQVTENGTKQTNPEPTRGTVDTGTGVARLPFKGRELLLTRSDVEKQRGAVRPGSGNTKTPEMPGTGATGNTQMPDKSGTEKGR